MPRPSPLPPGRARRAARLRPPAPPLRADHPAQGRQPAGQPGQRGSRRAGAHSSSRPTPSAPRPPTPAATPRSACWCSATSSTTPRCRSTAPARSSTATDAVEPLVDYFRCIAGEHPDWDEYRQAMRDQGKSLLRITPTRWGPVATGGFPAAAGRLPRTPGGGVRPPAASYAAEHPLEHREVSGRGRRRPARARAGRARARRRGWRRARSGSRTTHAPRPSSTHSSRADEPATLHPAHVVRDAGCAPSRARRRGRRPAAAARVISVSATSTS